MYRRVFSRGLGGDESVDGFDLVGHPLGAEVLTGAAKGVLAEFATAVRVVDQGEQVGG